MKYEKNKLIENGKNTLSVKVERVSLKSDSDGFDVLSYEINGKKKQIERFDSAFWRLLVIFFPSLFFSAFYFLWSHSLNISDL